jgi:hypothetical protein
VTAFDHERPASTAVADSPVQALVWVRLTGSVQREVFEEWLHTIRPVRSATFVAGDVDYELKLGCRSFADLAEVLTQIRGCRAVEVASTALVLHEVEGLGPRVRRRIQNEVTLRRLREA